MDDLDRRLREAGAIPVPPPEPAFATRLEDRLRAGAALAPEPTGAPTPRRGTRWYPVTAVAAALAVVVGATAVLRDGGEQSVRVASATNTVVVLPDGTVAPASPGLVVPDGSRLQTGDGGRVVAGDTELGPRQEAKVRKGTVKPSPTTAPPVKPSEPPIPPAAAPTAPTAPAAPPQNPSRPPATSPTTGPDTEPPPVVTPSTSKPATKPPTTRPPDTKPTTTPTSKPTGPAATAASLNLDARFKDETVTLQWSPYGGRDFAAYLVLRADGPAEPRYPVDGATTVVARITDPSATSFSETVAGPAGRRYRVVAVDSERRLIATSPAARPRPLA